MVGIIFIIIFYVAQNSVFSGNGKTIFEGLLMLFASYLITLLGFAMLKIRGYEAKWEQKLQRQAAAQAAAQTDTTVRNLLTVHHYSVKLAPTYAAAFDTQLLCHFIAAGVACISGSASCTALAIMQSASEQTGSTARCARCAAFVTWCLLYWKSACCPQVNTKAGKWGIFILAFTTTLREGLEAVVFIAGVSASLPVSSIPIPAVVGIIMGVTVGVLLYYTWVPCAFSLHVVKCFLQCLYHQVNGLWTALSHVFGVLLTLYCHMCPAGC